MEIWASGLSPNSASGNTANIVQRMFFLGGNCRKVLWNNHRFFARFPYPWIFNRPPHHYLLLLLTLLLLWSPNILKGFMQGNQSTTTKFIDFPLKIPYKKSWRLSTMKRAPSLDFFISSHIFSFRKRAEKNLNLLVFYAQYSSKSLLHFSTRFLNC